MSLSEPESDRIARPIRPPSEPESESDIQLTYGLTDSLTTYLGYVSGVHLRYARGEAKSRKKIGHPEKK